jgi:hypothetical protein
MLQKLGHRLVQPLHVLQLIVTWVQSLGCLAAPNELLQQPMDIQDSYPWHLIKLTVHAVIDKSYCQYPRSPQSPSIWSE